MRGASVSAKEKSFRLLQTSRGCSRLTKGHVGNSHLGTVVNFSSRSLDFKKPASVSFFLLLAFDASERFLLLYPEFPCKHEFSSKVSILINQRCTRLRYRVAILQVGKVNRVMDCKPTVKAYRQLSLEKN